MGSAEIGSAFYSHKDGKVIKKERVKQCGAMFEKTYVNKDGVIEKSEIKKMRDGKDGKDMRHKNNKSSFAMFEKIYVNKDGVI